MKSKAGDTKVHVVCRLVNRHKDLQIESQYAPYFLEKKDMRM